MNLSGNKLVHVPAKAVFKRTAIWLSALSCFSLAGSVSAKPDGTADAAKKTVKAAKQTKSDPVKSAEKSVKGLPKVYEFGAAWCVPCKKFAPTFEKIKEQYSGKAEFQTIDYDDPKAKALVDKYSISSVPTIIIADAAGKKKYEHSGILDEKDLVEQVNKVVGTTSQGSAK